MRLNYLCLLLVGIFFSCSEGTSEKYAEIAAPVTNFYVGNESCAECHENAFADWKGSDHDKAMDHATEESVLGNFNDHRQNFLGEEAHFFKRGGKFYVNTPARDGKYEELEIKYTFGHWPLQQYLIEFEKGHIQCLPITWDVQTNSWYHMADSVYADLDIDPDDWLYWTNHGQNWNAMCAECHSTNLEKNYELGDHSYTTTWSEINISCEACHGMASGHLDWAKRGKEGGDHFGFEHQSTGLDTEGQLGQCAFCHARRSSYGDHDFNGDHYLDQFTPQLINEQYYHFDGQIEEEDYVFTSFTQSRMYTMHVKCSDCHNVHSLKTKFSGNDLCLQCHKAEDYNNFEHHHHNGDQSVVQRFSPNGFYEQGDGSLCVDCHMPGKKYMGVDFRRDHSFKRPDPLLSKELGSPDVCTSCHADMSAEKADGHIADWFPKRSAKKQPYAEFKHIAEGEDYDLDLLAAILKDTSYALMTRASILSYLGRLNEQGAVELVKNELQAEEGLIRLASFESYIDRDMDRYVAESRAALNDELKAIRVEAFRKLYEIDYQAKDSAEAVLMATAEKEFVDFMKHNGDFASSRHNLAIYEYKKGNAMLALDHLKQALKIDGRYYPAMFELAIVYSSMGNNEQAEKWLNYLLSKDASNAQANRYMGMLKAEMSHKDEALYYFGKSIELEPENARNYYSAGILAFDLGKMEIGEQYMLSAIELEPVNYEYLYALAYFYTQQQRVEEAIGLCKRLLKLYPEDRNVLGLVEQLNSI